VEADKKQNLTREFFWRTLRERSIYIVWHDDAYSYSWCQEARNELLLIPHPVSRKPIFTFEASRGDHNWTDRSRLVLPPLASACTKLAQLFDNTDHFKASTKGQGSASLSNLDVCPFSSVSKKKF
jgi:hypothetical protein